MHAPSASPPQDETMEISATIPAAAFYTPATAPAPSQDANAADISHVGHVAADVAVPQRFVLEAPQLEPSGGNGNDACLADSSHLPVIAELSSPEAWQPLAGGIGLTSPLRRLLDTEDTQQQALQAVEVLCCHCQYHSRFTSV